MSSTLAGLDSLILSNNLDLILLQEVKVSKEQLNAMLSSLDFQAEVNLDTESPTLPGTAIAWRNSLPVEDVFILVKCRAQIAVLVNGMTVNQPTACLGFDNSLFMTSVLQLYLCKLCFRRFISEAISEVCFI